MYLHKRPDRGLALATLLVVAASGSAQAACYGPQQQLPAKTVAQFTAKPEQLLSKYPNGGAQMVSMVRDLVASDPAMLPFVLDLSPIGNADQVNSIGAGLGQAALVCSRTDRTFTGEIQQMVAAVNNQSLTLTFTAVLGDQQHAAAPDDRRGGGVQPAPAAIMGAIGPTPGTTGNVVALGPAPLSPPAGPGLTGSPVNSLTNPEGTTGATGLTGATFIGGIASASVATSQLGTGLTGATALGTNTSAIGSTVTTGALGTSSTGALGTSSTGALGTSSTGATATTGSGAGSGSQGTSSVLTAVNSTPSSFFTLSFNARGESIRTTNVSATSSSVSPSR